MKGYSEFKGAVRGIIYELTIWAISILVAMIILVAMGVK